MTRLFISLYLLIVSGIMSINWAAEQIWQRVNPQPNLQIQADHKLVNMLALTITDKTLAQVQSKLAIPLEKLSNDDIQWLPTQKASLMAGKVVTTFDNNGSYSHYALSPSLNGYLKLGPMSIAAVDQSFKTLILLASYLLLAVIIALWVAPLWRDLNKLKQASSQINQHGTPIIEVGKSSAIASVLTTFNNMSKKIGRLLDDQKQLTNAVSHEIRTPLSRLKFAFAALEGKDVSNLKAMQSDVAELEALVDELLDYARLENQTSALVAAEVDLHQLLTNQVEKHSINTDKTISLIIDNHLIWPCDGHLIERAIQNYLMNALRYAKTSVSVQVTAKTDKLVIAVEDDGVGVPPHSQATIFDAFHKLDKSERKGHSGFGLGLAIVQRIVDSHHGKCFSTASSLGGAKFVIELPRLEIML